MKKKLIKQGKDLVLVLDKTTLKKLAIGEHTELDVSVKNHTLIVKSKKEIKPKISKKSIDKIADDILDRYKDVFKKLATT